MEKRKLIEIIGLTTLLIVLLLVLLSRPERPPEIIGYTDNPEDWVEEVNGKKEILLEEITNGKSFKDGSTQQFIDGELWTAFELQGVYKGKIFSGEYKEDGLTLMRIDSIMDPKDGIIEAYIIENIVNKNTKEVDAYIFVDEDWKEQVSFTNIMWGAFYQNTKPFQFTEISEGIYMDKIKDSPGRFQENFAITRGGVAIGDISTSDIENNNIQGRTIVRLFS